MASLQSVTITRIDRRVLDGLEGLNVAIGCDWGPDNWGMERCNTWALIIMSIKYYE